MEKEVINPWKWQDQLGFVQANLITGAEKMLVCSGQTSVDDNGQPMHPGDMSAQVGQALDNIETVLKQAGMSVENIVRLNVYTTDVDAFLQGFGVITNRLANANFASTLLGVQRLAFPELMVELEATAVA